MARTVLKKSTATRIPDSNWNTEFGRIVRFTESKNSQALKRSSEKTLSACVKLLTEKVNGLTKAIMKAQRLTWLAAKDEAEAAQALLDASPPKSQRAREEMQSRVHRLVATAHELETRRASAEESWVWFDEVSEHLSDDDHRFFGMEKNEDNVWTGGFLRSDWDLKREDGTSRRYLDVDLVTRIAARKLFDLTSILEDTSFQPEERSKLLLDLLAHWQGGDWVVVEKEEA